MRKTIFIFFMLLLATLPLEAPAGKLTGRDVAVKMDAVDTSNDSRRTAIMVINRKGQKLMRKMESCNKKYGPDERGLIRFIEPPDVRGIMYLTWSYEDVNRDDDMWIFLPAESLVRRISGGGKKGSFMRSDFANEDIEKTETPRKESKTLMQYDNVDYNIGLSDSLFEQSNLKR